MLDIQKDKERFWSKVDIKGPEECHNWKAATYKGGYGAFRVNHKTYLAHRYAWSLANGPIPEGRLICHKCDNPKCVNIAHLYCGTNTDNVRDSWRRDRQPPRIPQMYGVGNAKLHEGEIWLIRKLWREGKNFLPQSKIAKMFKVNQSTISLIVNSTSYLCKEGKYV